MRKTAALSFAALAVAAVVAGAGCSNYGATATPGGSPTPVALPTTACTPWPGVQMVFPQSAPTGLPPTINQPNTQGVVFAVAPTPLPTNFYFYVSHPNPAGGADLTTLGTAQIGFLATPSPSPIPSPGATGSPAATPTPLPTPSDTPTITGTPIFETATIGTFATSTVFNVYLANTSCAPGVFMGKFTTAAVDLPSPSPVPSATATATAAATP
jgi:hypothetical protein